ncbi:hypothetical protein LXM94_01925 [Rhizobium sp. TRM95111]|uniref:hypothetical protein n=1 Tax=Rhizobium alarense TaxID=2846851 RepID=UPI001F2FE0DC|nr:hypothetical protein [Rhizobium alarense]MCF3638729.1 hypothetical protein [Rhizobium alarense]
MNEQPRNDVLALPFPPLSQEAAPAVLLESIMALRFEILPLHKGVVRATMGLPPQWSEPYSGMTPQQFDDLLTRIDQRLAEAWVAIHRLTQEPA